MVNGPRVRGFALADLVQRHLALQPVLAQLGVHQAQGQPGAVDRRVHLLEQVRQSAHVVFVPVREDDAQHPLLVLHDVGEVGQHQVDAEHLVIGEHEAGVEHEARVAILEDHHVLADGPQPAEGDHFESMFSHESGLCLRAEDRTAAAVRPRATRGACLVLKNVLQTDHESLQRPNAFDSQDHPGHERFPGQRVVPDGQRLPQTTEE